MIVPFCERNYEACWLKMCSHICIEELPTSRCTDNGMYGFLPMRPYIAVCMVSWYWQSLHRIMMMCSVLEGGVIFVFHTEGCSDCSMRREPLFIAIWVNPHWGIRRRRCALWRSSGGVCTRTDWESHGVHILMLVQLNFLSSVNLWMFGVVLLIEYQRA